MKLESLDKSQLIRLVKNLLKNRNLDNTFLLKGGTHLNDCMRRCLKNCQTPPPAPAPPSAPPSASASLLKLASAPTPAPTLPPVSLLKLDSTLDSTRASRFLALIYTDTPGKFLWIREYTKDVNPSPRVVIREETYYLGIRNLRINDTEASDDTGASETIPIRDNKVVLYKLLIGPENNLLNNMGLKIFTEPPQFFISDTIEIIKETGSNNYTISFKGNIYMAEINMSVGINTTLTKIHSFAFKFEMIRGDIQKKVIPNYIQLI